jgi:hypothetical protein
VKSDRKRDRAKRFFPSMKRHPMRIYLTVLAIAACSFVHGQAFPVPDRVVEGAFAGRAGAFVMIDCDSGVENKGRQYAFVCTAKGENLTGRDARGIVEAVLAKQGVPE